GGLVDASGLRKWAMSHSAVPSLRRRNRTIPGTCFSSISRASSARRTELVSTLRYVGQSASPRRPGSPPRVDGIPFPVHDEHQPAALTRPRTHPLWHLHPSSVLSAVS